MTDTSTSVLNEFQDDFEDTNILTIISENAERLKDALADVEAKREALAIAEHTARTIAETILPELMERAKMESFRTSTGLNVTIGEKIQATIPKATKPEALAWMNDNGYGAMIRNEVKAEFPVGQEAAALALLGNIKKLNTVQLATIDRNIHPSTFRSWAIKRLEEGKVLPSDLFSVIRQRQAIIE